MGGTRFAHLGETVRIDRATHDAIAAETMERLDGIGISAQPLQPLRAKADFGDVDLITRASMTHAGLSADPGEQRVELDRRDVVTAATAGAIAHDRGGIANPALHMLRETSAGLVQIDLMSIPDETFEFAEQHMRWGDAGSLVAVIARQMSMKAGMNGLRLIMPTRHGDVAAPLPLTHREMLGLLGYDADRHEAGFDTAEEMYAWVASGIYFDPRIWSGEWRTNRARARGMKRPAYTGWLEWLEARQPPPRYHWGERRGDRIAEWTATLRERFPSAAAQLDEEAERISRRQNTPLREFFSGKRIAAATGVDDEQLKHLMNAIRKEVGINGLQRLADAGDEEALLVVARRLAGIGL